MSGPTPAQREAKAFAKTYKGYSRFMRRMRRLAQRDDWVPSPNQAVVILKIRSTVGVNRQG